MLRFPRIILIAIMAQTFKTSATSQKDIEKSLKTSFKGFVEKFTPKLVWEKLDRKRKSRGKNYSEEEYLKEMFKGIDITDELMNLRVQNGDARVPVNETRRQLGYRTIEPRLFELMKQVIYQAREKMIIMQKLKKSYGFSALYKMGFLYSKADNAIKTFFKFAKHSYNACRKDRRAYYNLVLQERLLNLWFNADVLVELIYRNDRSARATIKNYTNNVIKNWKFEE